MKNKNGITLIALVITIIVLLILAGVSLSLVVGNNGILAQAKNATESYSTATAEEEIAMAWASLETDYLSAWANNASTTRGEIFTKPNIEKYLNGTGEVKEDEGFTYNEGGTSIIKYKSNASTKPDFEEFEISKDGKVTKKSNTSNAETPTNDKLIATVNITKNNNNKFNIKISFTEGNNISQGHMLYVYYIRGSGPIHVSSEYNDSGEYLFYYVQMDPENPGTIYIHDDSRAPDYTSTEIGQVTYVEGTDTYYIEKD